MEKVEFNIINNKWKLAYTFSSLPVVWKGGCVGEVGQSGCLSFIHHEYYL